MCMEGAKWLNWQGTGCWMPVTWIESLPHPNFGLVSFFPLVRAKGRKITRTPECNVCNCMQYLFCLVDMGQVHDPPFMWFMWFIRSCR